MAKIGRPSSNPNYDPIKARDELVQAVSDMYLHPDVDMDVDNEGHASMKALREYFGLTMTKIRKLLVTANVYTFEKDGEDLVQKIQELSNQGKTIGEIKAITGLSTGTVNSFLPYKKGVNNAEFTADEYEPQNVSPTAKRMRNLRKRKKMENESLIAERESSIAESRQAMDEQSKMHLERPTVEMSEVREDKDDIIRSAAEKEAAEKAKRRAENEARHQANLERKRAYHERKAKRQQEDPGGYLREIERARSIGFESHARELERAREIYGNASVFSVNSARTYK